MAATETQVVIPMRPGMNFTEPAAPLDGGGGPPHDPGMNDRITKLEANYDTLKVVRPMTITVIGVVASVFGLMIAFLLNQSFRLESKMSALESKIDSSNAALRTELRDEFRQMRADMNSQTSAVANAITATKQQAPQVLLVPTPVSPAEKKN